MSFLQNVEKLIDEKMRQWFSSAGSAPEQGRELIEIHRAILEEVESRAQSRPRGQRVFPYNHLAVTVQTEDAGHAAIYFEGNSLAGEIRELLEQEDCEVPRDLHTDVSFTDQPLPKGFHITYQRREAVREPARSAPDVTITIVHGEAGQSSYRLRKNRINIGRLGEVFDEQHRLVRRNDVVFADVEAPPNNTVSRTHAHIQFDTASGEFRLFDDRSAYGTSLFRDGRLIKVPPGGAPGVKLMPGDELYFGQARATFEY